MPSAVRRATSSMISRASCEAVISRKTSSSAPCASYASAASTGSPASRRSTKRTPLTTRPSLTSRHGMTRLANIYRKGVREATTLRGWPDPGATRLPSSPALTPGIREAAPLPNALCVIWPAPARSEEHTSELQSHVNLVCRLLLEKKKHIADVYLMFRTRQSLNEFNRVLARRASRAEHLNRACHLISYLPSRWLPFFFFNDTATTEIYTLSLHDALPI